MSICVYIGSVPAWSPYHFLCLCTFEGLFVVGFSDELRKTVVFDDRFDPFKGRDVDDDAGRGVVFGDHVPALDVRPRCSPLRAILSHLRYFIKDMQELVFCQAGLSDDCSKKSSAYFLSFMDRNDGHSSIGVLEDDVAASLSDWFKTYVLEGPDDRSTVSSPQLRQIAPR